MSEKRTVQVGGTPVSVKTVGTGPPVVFVHGLYVNAHLWDPVITEISSARTCYLPTLPLGAHTVAVGAQWCPTLDGLAGLVPGLIEVLDLAEVTVVANDTGGGLVLLALGSEHPALGRISRVVITNCDSYDHLPPTLLGPFFTMSRWAPFLAKAVLHGVLATSFGRRAFLSSVLAADPAPYIDSLFSTECLDEAVRVTAAVEPGKEQRAMSWLERLSIPVDLVWGDSDIFFPPSDAKRLHDAIPNSTLTWVPGARLFVSLDKPAEVAAAILSKP